MRSIIAWRSLRPCGLEGRRLVLKSDACPLDISCGCVMACNARALISKPEAVVSEAKALVCEIESVVFVVAC